MKKVISIIILVIGLGLILGITIMAITDTGIKLDEDKTTTRSVERVSAYVWQDGASEIYNLNINNKKHKLKLNYNATFAGALNSLDLIVYYDGKTIFNEMIVSNEKFKSVEELFQEEIIDENVHIKDRDINVISFNGKEYLKIDIGFYNYKLKEMVYFYDNDTLISNFVVRDYNKYYLNKDGSKLDIFYDENQTLFKIENDAIYYLKEENESKNILLKEYKYTFKDNQLVEELLNTYEVILKK